ncbi:uncharacterized protein METZ01_LOCUS329961 [marine metagenome]|uniref:Uncharacterized protein n=1 Tax=marine metagenome TaxID=408172 RepID=A0A382PW63_9ZZZZ
MEKKIRPNMKSVLRKVKQSNLRFLATAVILIVDSQLLAYVILNLEWSWMP